MLRNANCDHCGNKYGQVPIFTYLLVIGFIVLLTVVLAFVFQSVLLILLAFIPCLLFHFMPYSKLDDEGKVCDENTDLLCQIAIVGKFDKIKHNEIYFLNKCFDDFKPFTIASPIHIYCISKKDDMLLGEFLYMHEKNFDYMKKDSCDLYDTEMNLVAKIKFITDTDTSPYI